ncbi:MAG TPA: TolC family protein, partial [Labilithrix sp.]|nr:TolC family protein [Labilithrix sp.]
TNVTYVTAATGAASLRWTVLDFGRTGHAVDVAQATREANVAGVLDTEASLVATVANAYLDVVYGEKVREIARSIVDEREKSVEIVKGLAKHGLAPAVDELRARARVEAARRDLELADAQLAEARAGLLAFLGLDTRSPPSFVAPRLPRQRPDVEGAVKDSENKPAVVSARHGLASEEAGVDAARARYYPYLSLSGDASYRYARVDVYDQWLPTKVASGALVLTIPLYDPTTGPRLAGARADVEKATAIYEQTRRDARTEAAKSAVVLGTNERVLDHARKAAESATAVLTVIRARWVAGLSSTLELIEAETSDAEARLASVRAERSLDGATVRLYTATGRTARLYDL